MRFHNNLNVVIECDQEPQQAFDGELAKLAAQHFRDIGLAHAEQLSGFDLLESAFLQNCVDFEYKLRFVQVLFGVGHTDVLKHIAAPLSECLLMLIASPLWLFAQPGAVVA
jgi:hypothetical protein